MLSQLSEKILRYVFALLLLLFIFKPYDLFAANCAQDLNAATTTSKQDFIKLFTPFLEKAISSGKLTEDDLLKSKFSVAVSKENPKFKVFALVQDNQFILFRSKERWVRKPQQFMMKFIRSGTSFNSSDGAGSIYVLEHGKDRFGTDLELDDNSLIHLSHSHYSGSYGYYVATIHPGTSSPKTILQKFAGGEDESE